MSGKSASPVGQVWRVVGGLLLVALVPAVLSGWLHPRKPTWQHADRVSVAAVNAWDGVLWVDARESEAFDRGHVPGALNLTPGRWDSLIEAVLVNWEPGRRVVVYCDGHTCNASHEVAERLRREMGLDRVYVLTGGWEEWLKAQEGLR